MHVFIIKKCVVKNINGQKSIQIQINKPNIVFKFKRTLATNLTKPLLNKIHQGDHVAWGGYNSDENVTHIFD